MASSKAYLDFVLEQSSGLSARALLGEYVLYYGDKVVGGVYETACSLSLRHLQGHLCRA